MAIKLLIIRLLQIGKKIQTAINTTPQGEFANGKEFDSVGSTDLFNSNKRFSDPYTNKFKGWMFVADAAAWLYKKDLLFAVTAGIASGDDNPNIDNKDGIFSGFISLQELYSGKRVKSAFVLGGSGKIKRPLSVRIQMRFKRRVLLLLQFLALPILYLPVVHSYGRLVIGKKNLVLIQTSLAYWQEKPTNKFDALKRKE